MATHSSVLARKIPGTEEPGGLPSMGSHRVGRVSSILYIKKTNKQNPTMTRCVDGFYMSMCCQRLPLPLPLFCCKEE